MADEISISINMQATRDTNFKEKFQPGNKKYDMSASLSAAGVCVATSNSTQLSLGTVQAQAGWGFFTNLSTAMDILMGPTTTHWLRLPPEASELMHFISAPTIVVATTANTANLQWLILST